MNTNNIVVATGHLARDPDIKVTRTGKRVARFTVACGYEIGDKKYTDWVPVTAWGGLAEFCETDLWKGLLVTVTGRFTTYSWEDNNHQRHYMSYVNAESIAVIPTSSQSTGGGGGYQNSGYGNGGYGGGYQQQQQAPSPSRTKANFNQFAAQPQQPAPQQPQYQQPPQQQQAVPAAATQPVGATGGPGDDVDIPF